MFNIILGPAEIRSQVNSLTIGLIDSYLDVGLYLPLFRSLRQVLRNQMEKRKYAKT